MPTGGLHAGGATHPPPPRTRKAGGTHPTGMLSCLAIFPRKRYENKRNWIGKETVATYAALVYSWFVKETIESLTWKRTKVHL